MKKKRKKKVEYFVGQFLVVVDVLVGYYFYVFEYYVLVLVFCKIISIFI